MHEGVLTVLVSRNFLRISASVSEAASAALASGAQAAVAAPPTESHGHGTPDVRVHPGWSLAVPLARARGPVSGASEPPGPLDGLLGMGSDTEDSTRLALKNQSDSTWYAQLYGGHAGATAVTVVQLATIEPPGRRAPRHRDCHCGATERLQWKRRMTVMAS